MPISTSIPIAASTAASAKPAPATTTSAAGTSTALTAAQLAKETVTQLQKQANAGNKAAMRELQRRAKLKQEHNGTTTKGSIDASATQETASPQEPGKGSQIDKAA